MGVIGSVWAASGDDDRLFVGLRGALFENLYTVVIVIRNVYFSIVTHCNPVWRVHQARIEAETAQLLNELPVGAEFLDPIVIAIHDIYVSLDVDGNSFWPGKLPIAVTLTSPLSDKLPRRTELLDNVVAGIRHIYVPLGVDGDSF